MKICVSTLYDVRTTTNFSERIPVVKDAWLYSSDVLVPPKPGARGSYPALIATCQKGEHLIYDNALKRSGHNQCRAGQL